MYKVIDAIVIVVIIVGISTGMRHVSELYQYRSLQLHELSEEMTHLRIIIENQNKQKIRNNKPWGGV